MYGSTFARFQRTLPSIDFAYGSISSLFGVEAVTGARVVRAVDAVAVALARADVGQVARAS